MTWSQAAELRPNGIALLVVAAAPFVGVGAAVAPRRIVEAALALGLVLLIIRSLLFGVILFVVVTFPSNLPQIGGAGATLAKPVGAALAISWLFALLATRDRSRMRVLVRDEPLIATLVVSFGAWALISTAWAFNSSVARSEASRLLQVLLLFFIIFTAVRSGRELRLIALSFVVASGLMSTYALASGVTAAGRLTGGVANANMFAAELVAAASLGVFMLGLPLRGRLRLLLLAVLAVDAMAFVRTGSRGGLVAIAIAFVLAVAVAGPLRARIVGGGLIAAAAAVTYYVAFAPAQLREHVTVVTPQASASRTDLWKIALRMAHDHLFLGVGIGNFRLLEFDYLAQTINLLNVQEELHVGLVAHNTYLGILAELGLVGLVLFAALCVAVAAAGLRSFAALIRDGDPTAHVVRGLLVGTGGLLAAYFFDSGEYEKQLWTLLALVAASTCAVVVRHQPAAPRRLR
ncbi:MAG TPA: O-antigen ligase family protein [Gaiellaceae bacterium]|nr:O-antigen ligase family protein [Gaiellaceae bacterium]